MQSLVLRKDKRFSWCWRPLVILVLACAAFGSQEAEIGIHDQVAGLVLQLAIIIFAGRLFGMLFQRFRMPPVIGELCAGIVIGPYLLGSIALPGFPQGLFPLADVNVIPVQSELYWLASIAAILLLFNAGLETDITMLVKFSVAGAGVGLGGVVVSFFSGAAATGLVLGISPWSPLSLFMGTISTATSVGIATRILRDTRKVESPEGLMILAGAVIDDIIGIVLLAVISGVALRGARADQGGTLATIGLITLRTLLVWLGFTALGLLASKYITRFLKWFKSITTIAIMALALSFILAAVFERAGLAMIIGAYVAGLSLSRSDMRYVIVERLHPLHVFMVPVFFTVMGMFVNMAQVLSGRALALGLSFAIVSIGAKLLGCGGPALLSGFNRLGALRIGLGMTPRSEVALIIAGVGLAGGVLTDEAFAASAMMVLLSALAVPPFLEALLRNPQSGMRQPVPDPGRVSMRFDFPSNDIADFFVIKVLDYFNAEGFFVYSLAAERTYRLNRNDMSISMVNTGESLVFETGRDNIVFVKTVIYEALLNIHEAFGRLKDLAKPESLRGEITQGDRRSTDIVSALVEMSCMRTALGGRTKREIIEELLDVLTKNGKVLDRVIALKDVLDREESMSTGMQWGIALPHAKTSAVSRISVAVGLKREGIDFQSLDGQPSRIFIMVLSPEQASGPHIQFLAGVSSLLNSEESRTRLLACRTEREMLAFFKHDLKRAPGIAK